MKRAIFTLLACMLMVGCATDVANRYYGEEHYPEKAPSQVAILSEEPTRAYVVIADFQSRGDTPETLREKAAKIGADAIIVTSLGGLYNRGDQWAGNDSMSNSYSRIVGTAIKYK